MKRLPLIWRVFVSTSLFTTLLFVVIGYIVQDHSSRATALMLEDELGSSFRAYESLWRSRSEFLRSISQVISGMPDVRAAFGTGDKATIRDTAGELWSRISRADAIFLVTDPEGRVIASLGDSGLLSQSSPLLSIPAVQAAAPRFPEQGSGFVFLGNRLHQVVVTPVYVDSGRGRALLNVLVAGFAVDDTLAATLKESTGGSDSLIIAHGDVVASTLPADAARQLARAKLAGNGLQPVRVGPETWSVLSTELNDVAGNPVGELRILRPFTSASRRLADLRVEIAVVWAAAILFALLITFLVANRLLGPVKLLD